MTETVDNTIDEYRVLKETGTVAPDDNSLRAIDVLESLVIVRSVDDGMRLLLVLTRVPFEEMLRENGFYAEEAALFLCCSLPNRSVILIIL